MVIKLDDCYGNVELEEFLEPSGAGYEIRQGENKIQLSNYLIEELDKSIQFVLFRDKLCKSELLK